MAPSAPMASATAEEPEFRISAIVDAPRKPVATTHWDTLGLAGKARWIPKDEVIEIQKLTIAGGMVYVGGKLGGDRWSEENCLINPKLPIAMAGRGSTADMGYWARYKDISSANRRAFLEWLAGGRCDPSADIGLVFLYFYGLEYRLFKERAVADSVLLTAEVERLLKVYGENHSFEGYARRFLEAASLTIPGRTSTRPPIHLEGWYSYEMPLDARLWLGGKLAAGQTLDADDALLWLSAMPDRSFRTPVTRCSEEFQALWRIRFDALHPTGLGVKAPKGRIKATYRAASGTFEVVIDGAHGSIPDIATISAPLKKLRDLAEACTVELESFSRYVGKRPEERNGLQAALLLPEVLPGPAAVWKALRERIGSLLADRPSSCVRLSELFGAVGMPVPAGGRVPQAVIAQLGRILDRVDVGFEPDRRYGGSMLEASATVCLFEAPQGAPVDAERPEYLMFRGMIEIVCLAAASDGDIAPEEIGTVLVELQASKALHGAEKLRLAGYARSIHLDPPKQQAVLRRLADRPAGEREACARAAFAAVMADGHAAPSEVRFLEKLYKALSLPTDNIYVAIHRGGMDGGEASRAPVGQIDTGGVSAARNRIEAGNVIAINASRLDRVRRETQAVSSLLSDIFVEDELGTSGPTHQVAAAIETGMAEAFDPSPAPELYLGLDAAHGDLLGALLVMERFDRDAFDREAKVRDLLPDGALETINEWSFDRFGDALLEGDEDLVIVSHLRDQLPTFRAAA